MPLLREAVQLVLPVALVIEGVRRIAILAGRGRGLGRWLRLRDRGRLGGVRGAVTSTSPTRNRLARGRPPPAAMTRAWIATGVGRDGGPGRTDVFGRRRGAEQRQAVAPLRGRRPSGGG